MARGRAQGFAAGALCLVLSSAWTLALLWPAPATAARFRCPRGSRLERKRSGHSRIKRCVRRRDSALHGPFERRYRGRVKERGAYRDGRRHGPWTHAFRNSRDVGRYEDGAKVGRWRTELYTGELHELDYVDGKLHGLIQKRDKQGVVRDRYEMRDGLRHGGHVGKWLDGTQRINERYVAGKREGVARRWHQDGSVAAVAHWRAGKLHGAFERRWPGGALLEAGRYVDGERDGVWRGQFADSTALYEGRWARGKQVGAWRFFGRDGGVASAWQAAKVPADPPRAPRPSPPPQAVEPSPGG